jgi:ATP-dependent helicase/nuclease subunit B
VQARLILGPAGSGKTFCCLAEIRAALAAAPDGPPLLLLAPKQTTFQLERQLLADPALPGYARLQILSFERLTRFILHELQPAPPKILNEEGRLMVLRGLLAKKRNELRLFRASARLNGFAQHLSLALRELQRQQLTPESLAELAEHAQAVAGLGDKLHDLATLLRDYLDWLAARGLQDAEHLLDFAVETLRAPHPPLPLGGVWVDGFTEMSRQELGLLAELLPLAPRAAITFCLDQIPTEKISWLSHWSVVRQTYHQCRERLATLPNCHVTTELLPQKTGHGRFNAVLRHLEADWAEPKPFHGTASSVNSSLRVAICSNPEAEVTLAACEILRFVRAGGRYREITVLARNLADYHAALVNIFARYEIPVFIDQREPVSHHPLAELTRNALRTVAYSWKHEDWFAALKTGLVPAAEADIDRLENEALARGWRGQIWLKPISVPNEPELEPWLEDVRRKIVPPFNRLAVTLAGHNGKPNGPQLAAALRELWEVLRVAETLEQWSAGENQPIHLTVREQMIAWLENIEQAFPAEAMPLREWLPVLEAGLAGLTVGVIPPALDQVFIGAIDRSRTPDIRLSIVLGMNETVFPAPPSPSVLLTDTDRAELEKQGISLSNARRELGRERFYGYLACTRARERLVLTACECDTAGRPLNLSPFLGHAKKLFPTLEFEKPAATPDWRQSEHASELIVPLLRNKIPGGSDKLKDLPALKPVLESLLHLTAVSESEAVSPALAARLYGPSLRTSVSRMEQFAACPFKFFVHSGLRAEERKLFELDVRNQGNFQHDVLACFHDQLRAEGKRWRDLTPAAARARIKQVAASMLLTFHDGLLQASEESRFTARMLTESLQDFVETLVGWMRGQYAFDPVAVEIAFGDKDGVFPAWELDLGEARRLLLHGRIDRVDICRDTNSDSAPCVVVDYKSGGRQLDPLLMANGLPLQLAAYLNVLRHWPNPSPLFGVACLLPAGMFYVSLRGKYERAEHRDESLADAARARQLAYQHTGRFDAQYLRKLDQRPDAVKGDQFNYTLKQDGTISANSREALGTAEFIALLDAVENILREMGRAVYAGVAKVDPYRKGNVTACDQCDYRAICRIDPWTHSYRVLRKAEDES